MGDNESLELVFVPWPVMGHIQIVQLANLIIKRQSSVLSQGAKVSVTVLIMKLPDHIDTVTSSYMDSVCSSSENSNLSSVNFFQLPPTDPAPEWSSRTRGYFIDSLVKSHNSNVADYLSLRRPKIVGLVVDMLCTSMIDVAEEFCIPSYVFVPSPASFLGSMLHCQTIHDEENQDVAELRNSVSNLSFPCFLEPVPPGVLSLVMVDKQQWLDRFLHYARDYRKAKGIVVNTFSELEAYALDSFSQDMAYGNGRVPPVYAVGPILNLEPHEGSQGNISEILKWLDEQPVSSVLFVCFGSQGSLREEQIRELARGLEGSGCRFLWSLRRQSANDKRASFPSEYASYTEVLPEGFLERTAGIGKVVGWAPQLHVLSNPAVGGFLSHCGWNSVLESLWCGVPIATWPLHAEQQMNAFQLVKELGLAVEITLSYYERSEDGIMVSAGVIEKGIRELMDSGGEARKKVKQMKEASRASMVKGGSSYESLGMFIKHLMSNK